MCCLPHLVHIPSLTPLTAWCFPCGNLEDLGRHADRSLHAQFLRLCTLDELAAHLLERSDFAGRKRDADLVDLWLVELRRLLWVLVRHFGGRIELIVKSRFGLEGSVESDHDFNSYQLRTR